MRGALTGGKARGLGGAPGAARELRENIDASLDPTELSAFPGKNAFENFQGATQLRTGLRLIQQTLQACNNSWMLVVGITS